MIARLWNKIVGRQELLNVIENTARDAEMYRSELALLREHLSTTRITNVHLRSALSNVISMETPSANATVKRMARIAREALDQ